MNRNIGLTNSKNHFNIPLNQTTGFSNKLFTLFAILITTLRGGTSSGIFTLVLIRRVSTIKFKKLSNPKKGNFYFIFRMMFLFGRMMEKNISNVKIIICHVTQSDSQVYSFFRCW